MVSVFRLLPFLQEGDHFRRVVVVAFLKLAGVLRRQLFSVAIKDDENREAKLRGVSVALYHIVIVTFIDVNEDYDVVFFDNPGNGSVRVEQTAQLMAPPSPVGSELENDALPTTESIIATAAEFVKAT